MTHKEAVKAIFKIDEFRRSTILTWEQKCELIDLSQFKDYPLHTDWPYTDENTYEETVHAWANYLVDCVLPAAQEAVRIEELYDN